MKLKSYSIALIGSILLISFNACNNNSSEQSKTMNTSENTEEIDEANKKYISELGLDSINLLRGEILLCGDGQFGDVDFSLSCDYDIRETFGLAISLLHSFEYAEAEKAFVQVIDADPDSAMAYWGVAMSMYHELWAPPGNKALEKGNYLLNIAATLPMSEREQEYLGAINAYYTNWDKLNHNTRAKNMESKMEEMYNKYPDDAEVAIFYSLALRSTADPSDKEYTNQRRSGEILEALFPNQPNHPGIAHYIIHNYDYPELAHKALETARKYSDIAPGSAHAQHMPSHIFIRLGLWEESIASNLRAAAAAVCYSEETNMEGHWAQEIHALDYLVYAYLQLGDNTRANEQYEYLKAIDKIHPVGVFAIAYPFAAIPARLAIENKDWEAASQLEVLTTEQLPWEQFPWEEAIIHFARSLGASNIGNLDLAQDELAKIQSLHHELVKREDAYKSSQVMIQIKAAQAWLNFAKGNNNEAIALMQESVDMEDATEKHPVTPGEVIPARELLGDLYMAMNRPSEALETYEQDIEIHPNRFNGYYGAAIASKNSGNIDKTSYYFNKLVDLTNQSESNRPEIDEAIAFLNKTL